MLALYVVGYFIGTAVAINTNNVGLTAMFFLGIGLVAGLNLGHLAEKRNQQAMEQIRERYNA